MDVYSEWEDVINKPKDVFRRMVELNINKNKPNDVLKFHRDFSGMIKEKIEDQQKFLSIPYLNCMKSLDHKPSNTLVRFRCMVQDMFDPEFFMAYYETQDSDDPQKRCHFGLYQDFLSESSSADNQTSIDFDSDKNITLSRSTYVCVSVPGENSWVRDKWSSITSSDPTPQSSNPVDEDSMDHNASASGSDTNHSKETTPDKKAAARGSEEVINDSEDPMAVTKKVKVNEGPATKTSSAAAGVNKRGQKYSSLVNECFPINDLNPNRRACLIKIYDTDNDKSESACLKLNDIMDVIGIIDFGTPQVNHEAENRSSVSKEASGDSRMDDVNALIHDMELLDDPESGIHSVPASIVPRIHVLTLKKINHINPLVLSSDATKHEKNVASDKPKVNVDREFFQKMHRELHAILSQAMFGDEVAAEYLICCLISRIYMRKDILSLGSFPVSICNIPKDMTRGDLREYTRNFYGLISNLVTHSVYFPLSLDALNSGRFIPKKDYTNNKLVSGHLQLPHGMLLFVDETQMDSGRLSGEGLSHLSAVCDMIRWQKMTYDFEYHQMELDTDLLPLVISEGKSMLPVNFRIPLKVINLCSSHPFLSIIPLLLS